MRIYLLSVGHVRLGALTPFPVLMKSWCFLFIDSFEHGLIKPRLLG